MKRCVAAVQHLLSGCMLRAACMHNVTLAE